MYFLLALYKKTTEAWVAGMCHFHVFISDRSAIVTKWNYRVDILSHPQNVLDIHNLQFTVQSHTPWRQLFCCHKGHELTLSFSSRLLHSQLIELLLLQLKSTISTNFGTVYGLRWVKGVKLSVLTLKRGDPLIFHRRVLGFLGQDCEMCKMIAWEMDW